MAESNIQIVTAKARRYYEGQGQPPLLRQLCKIHGISIREFSTIFDVSKSQAAYVMNQEVLPSLELGIRLARYWGVSVEDLFGWRVEDDGARRPLIIKNMKTGRLIRLNAANKKNGVLDLAKERKASCGENG